MKFTRLLCEELNKYNNVIIYGYGDVGVSILDYIIELETSIKIANYSGKVKFFTTSYVERSLRTEIKGIKIKPVYELKEYNEKSLIIIATQEKHQKSIKKILDELSFKNRIFVSHADYCEIRECIENYKGISNTQIGQYQLNHQIKLDRLRLKVRDGKKVKVFFMTHDRAVFGAASVYREMEKDDLFEPYIYVVSRRDVTYADFYEEVLKDVEFFQSQGYKVICGYDEHKNPKDLHMYSPDIVFYDIPKLYGSAGAHYNRLDRINWEYLTCYIPYALLMVDSFYYHYHTRCIRESWKFFLDTKDSYKRVMADGDFCGYNLVLSGYPKFDDYDKDNPSTGLFKNDNPVVIYAPHHSLGVSNNFATFDLYGNQILEFVKSNPNINFVFKPHPLLKFQIRQRYREGVIKISYEEYCRYCEEWESLENAVIVEDGNYIDIFKESCCMITDCGSFIGEYLPSLNPCIYIFNPRKNEQEEVYTSLAKKILQTYYVVKDEKELDEKLQQVIIKKCDERRGEREFVLQSEFGNIGKAGELIKEHIKNTLL